MFDGPGEISHSRSGSGANTNHVGPQLDSVVEEVTLNSCVVGSNPLHPSCGTLGAILPLSPRRLHLPIPLGLNLPLMPADHVLRRDVTDGATQTPDVVMLYVTVS